jgi:hypothetical protein
MKILYDATVSAGANVYYGTMIVSNLRYEDGSTVNVSEYLAMTFDSPASVADTDINASFMSWVAVTADVTSNQIDTGSYLVSAHLAYAQPHTMEPGDQFTIGVNGDLTKDADAYLNSFVIAADRSPDVNGTVSIKCAESPDAALIDIAPTVTFTIGSQATPVALSYGETTNATLAQGDYSIRGDTVSTADLTVIAPLVIAPTQITVRSGATVPASVSFGALQRYAALDISIGALSGLTGETFAVSVIDTACGQTLASFTSGVNVMTSLRKLAPSGTAQIRIQAIALNNVAYSFKVPDVVLANALQSVLIGDSMVKAAAIDTTGFADLLIDVSPGVDLQRQVTLRLAGAGMNYTQVLSVADGDTVMSVPVKPDTYAVSVGSFVSAGVVYVVDTPDTIVVTGSGPAILDMAVAESANLNVPGFPSFLSFGGCADLTPGNVADFAAARASSIFNYAGVDGAGDAATYLTDDQSTRQTIQLARDVEAQLGDGQRVLPVMISYTCNLSLGDTVHMLADADQHAHSFANFILSLNIANSVIDAEHPVPMGYVVNPDFLGSCQQGGFGPDYGMPVRAPLRTALDHWSIEATIPADITEDVSGYVAAVNWLTRTVAPKVVFGWQVNLWGVGYSEWIYEDSDTAAFAQQTADYVKSVAAYDGPHAPDFLAVDRYEADDFEQRAYVNGYCYGPREWQRFFDFCTTISRALKLPVMPWQIPASRTPVTTDQVNRDFEGQHWGTGGSYLLGDAAVGSDYHHVHPNILALQFPPVFQADMGASAEDMFIRSVPFDISSPAYSDFPVRGFFTLLLGGGSTTGIISAVGNPEPWVRNKLNAYMDNPIRFDE